MSDLMFSEDLERIDPRRVIAILGDEGSANQSLSPQMWNAAFLDADMDQTWVYRREPVNPEDLSDWVYRMQPSMRDRDYRIGGFSVTAPHKVQILDQDLVTPTDAAREIGAANTLLVKDTQIGFRADNTDWLGSNQAIELALGQDSINGTSALILGAGGAARAIAYGLVYAGANQVNVINRSIGNAADLTEFIESQDGQVPSEFTTFEDREGVQDMLAGADLVINASSVGRQNPNERLVDIGWFPSDDKAVFETNYHHPTDLYRQAVKFRFNVVEGADMLVMQAVEQFKLMGAFDQAVYPWDAERLASIMRATLYSHIYPEGRPNTS